MSIIKRNWPKVLCFLIILFLYFLPSILFPADNQYYYSLKGPHLPPWVFITMWSIIYVCMGIFITYYIFYKQNKKNIEIKRLYVFLIINYVFQALYMPVFFKWHNLFFSYILVLLTFITILITALESLLINKKITILTIPYIVWSLIASVLAILLYLQN